MTKKVQKMSYHTFTSTGCTGHANELYFAVTIDCKITKMYRNAMMSWIYFKMEIPVIFISGKHPIQIYTT